MRKNLRPEIKTNCVDNLFFKMMYFKEVGEVEKTPKQKFSGCLLLANGSLNIKVDSLEKNFHAPHIVYVRPNKIYNITSTSNDSVAFFVQALRDENLKQVIDPKDIPSDSEITDFGIDQETIL